MVDCSKYLKKLYIGVGIFCILVLMRTFPNIVTTGSVFLNSIIAIIIVIVSLIFALPYFGCIEKNDKKW